MKETYQVRITIMLAKVNRKRPWLANRTGIPIGTINGWYRGRIPRVDHLYLVAKALGTTVEYLWAGTDSEIGEDSPCKKRLIHWIDMMSDDSIIQLEHIIAALGNISIQSIERIRNELNKPIH
ncbi:MAG: helix-turn-helix transcriptional regulator [Spirochaetales bacterium]|nr:helix-turn-helix transcriptional regulator [Spirochaetales bacterium]